MVTLLLTAAGCGASIFLTRLHPVWCWPALGCLALLTAQTALLFRQSRTDALTGLYNLRRLEDDAGAYRRHTALEVWYFDLDHLKAVNDAEGHAAGDRLLQEFSAALRRDLPRRAGAYRIGGDEFLLVLPGGGAPALLHDADLPATWGHAAGPGTELKALITRAEAEMYRKRRTHREN